MDHQQAHEEAIRKQAAERYLLDDLTEAERDAFEDHYFDCLICGNTVREGLAFFAAGREAAKSLQVAKSTEDKKVVPFPRHRWLTARATAASLAVVVGVQGIAMQRLWVAQPPPIALIAPGFHIAGPARSGEGHKTDITIQFQGDQAFDCTVEIPPVPAFANYRIELRGPSGKSLGVANPTGAQVRNEQGDYLHFLLRPLPAGRYVLVIEGVREDGNRSAITTQNIVVQ